MRAMFITRMDNAMELRGWNGEYPEGRFFVYYFTQTFQTNKVKKPVYSESKNRQVLFI